VGGLFFFFFFFEFFVVFFFCLFFFFFFAEGLIQCCQICGYMNFSMRLGEGYGRGRCILTPVDLNSLAGKFVPVHQRFTDRRRSSFAALFLIFGGVLGRGQRLGVFFVSSNNPPNRQVVRQP